MADYTYMVAGGFTVGVLLGVAARLARQSGTLIVLAFMGGLAYGLNSIPAEFLAHGSSMVLGGIVGQLAADRILLWIKE